MLLLQLLSHIQGYIEFCETELKYQFSINFCIKTRSLELAKLQLQLLSYIQGYTELKLYEGQNNH